VTLGGVVLVHGMQKVLGWFGGGGFSGTVDFFQNVLHLPAAVALLVTFSDFVGSLALIAGFMTRAAALGTGLVMLGAVATVHAQNGFFMNWFGNQAGEGFEFHLLALALVAALIRSGGGRASLDARLVRATEP
jgi:putative oxidoreductase